jgi:hypothetical protein
MVLQIDKRGVAGFNTITVMGAKYGYSAGNAYRPPDLARYTHRVAISNQRLVSLEDGRVAFRYKDYADDHRSKTMTLSAEEFLRRCVQHVLPKGFVKVRHYGLLAPRGRDERLALCRPGSQVVRSAAATA